MSDYLFDEGKNKIEGLNKTEINEALNSKADAQAVASAFQSVDTALNGKASTEALNDAVNGINTELNQKADSNFVNKKYAAIFDNLISDAGNFTPANSWYATSGASGYNVTNGIATFTATAQYGGIKILQGAMVYANHQYYLFAKIKANNKICLSYDGVGAAFSNGGEEFEFVSGIYNSNSTRTRYITISDNNTTGFGKVEVKEVGLIDLTNTYGENVPSKSDIDAKIAPMGFISLSTAGKLANALNAQVSTIQETVNSIESQIDTRTYKLITLGDSITAFGTGSRGWIKYFKEKINADLIANTAVDGAWLHDKEAGTIYDGNPQAGDNNLNVLGNQVQKILNNNYAAPDLIMIAIGTNSGINITEQQMKDVYFYNYQFVDIDAVDRTTDAGAYRWCLEKLHNKYPNAIIIWCSPIHGAEPTMKSATSIMAWGESLRIATGMTGQQFIESFRCGINGWKEVMNAEGEYLADGLHPNATGAKKLGYYNASCVKNILMQVF